MSTADDTFLKQFGLVLAILFVFTVAMFFLANGIGGPAMSDVRNSNSAVQERIARVGAVRFEGDAIEAAAPVAVAAAAPAAGGAKGGEEVYNLACIACHASGAAGAPMLGDEAAWEGRTEQGLEALIGHAINGKGAMPAKGGNATLSDEEVANAVKWMLDQTGLELAGAAPAATEAPAANEATAATEAPAANEATAATEAPAASEAPAAAATEAPAASEAATAAAAAPAAEETAPAAEETAAAAPAAAEEGKPGAEVYAMGCNACHMTGAAGAPKVGDNAAWQSRVAGGVDAVIHNAINGKGIMPAKGGLSFLSDADVANAVRHMLAESGIE